MYRPPPSIGSKLSQWDGGMDVPSGSVPAVVRRAVMVGRHEHSGGLPGVRAAPGHGAQDAGLLGPAGVTAGRALPGSPSWSPSPASSTRSLRKTSGFPGSSATPPSGSSSGCRTSTASAADTPSSRTTSGSTAARPGRCSCPCPTPRATPRATSARPGQLSAEWNRKPTASSWTCPTATAAS